MAAIEDNYRTADATRHGGDFGRIVEGVNQTLDSVIWPLAGGSRICRQDRQGRDSGKESR